MIKFEDTDSYRCLCCNSKDNHVQKIRLMRDFRNENIISFTICDSCIIEMAMDIRKQLDFLNDCEKKYRNE